MSLIVTSTLLYSQDIFQKNGYNKDMLTLSKGKYKETFINEEIMQIGTVLFNTKTKEVVEFLEEDISDTAYRAEYTSRWLSRDPLAEKYYWNSPYVYCNNNPIRYVDPDGKKIVITGEAAQAVFKQLKQATSLRLKINDGVVSVKGNAKTDADKMLLSAIKDENIIVSIDATNSNYTEEGKWFVGGAYGGSEIGEDGKVYTKQTINPTMTETIDNFYESESGVTTMHEVLESYAGGIDSPGSGVPTFDNTTPEFKAYGKAHDKAKAADPRYKEPIITIIEEIGKPFVKKVNPITGAIEFKIIND